MDGKVRGVTVTSRGFELTFQGTTALVTGAASGIGKATVERFLDCGIEVLALDRSVSPAVTRNGVSSFPFAADVRNTDQLKLAIAEFGRAPNYVVNCAGILDPTGFNNVDREAFMKVLDVNLVGAYQVIDLVRDAGALLSVVNVTSIEATRVVALSDPDPHPAYSASKAALTMLTKTAARALAPLGVRVNSVAPGFVLTPMAQEHGGQESLPPVLGHRVPLGTYAEASQIADSIAFLSSDQASYITGSELVVDGGFRQT
ncbi:hypothetical protein BLJ79_07000 [Arthrobacter sp. UCD-GKA]|nr:hypothetical protein BLJ79_07000 [Arthrobacter sp. UCD-GKA]